MASQEALETDLPHWIFFKYDPSIRDISAELSHFHKQPFNWKMIYLSKCSQEYSIAWKTKFLMEGLKKEKENLYCLEIALNTLKFSHNSYEKEGQFGS